MALKQQVKEPLRVTAFAWSGRDANKRLVNGVTSARDLTSLRAQLLKQGISLVRASKHKESAFARLNQKPIKSADITFFTRQLATMINAGVPILQGLDIVGSDQSNPAFKKMIDAIRLNVDSGMPLSDGMAQFPKHFDPLYLNLIRIGEDAGILDQVLVRLADYRERSESLKAKVKKAMIYPSAVITVAIAVTAILLLYVVPQFEAIFASSGAPLPLLTRLVISASEALSQWGFALMIVLVGLIIFLMRAWKQSEKFQRVVARMVLGLPILGPIMHQASLARFARTLSTTFAAGVPIIDSLTSVSRATGNPIYTDAVLRMRDSVATGQSLNFAMSQEPLFPNLVRQMTTIGEESGSLESLLTKVADYYEEAVNNAVDSINSLLEPLIIVFLGAIAGTLVVAMYMPIFQLGDVMG